MLLKHDEYGLKDVHEDFVEKFILLDWYPVDDEIKDNHPQKRGRPPGAKNKDKP